jgi:virulence factor
MQRQLNIGILGGGDIAWKAYLPMLVKWSQIDIRGLYSRTMETADKIAAHFGVDFRTDDLGALIERDLDAAFVLAHTDSHFELVKALLEAGVDVFVEKPATISSVQTHALAELADKEKRVLMVGFNRRYASLYRQGKELFGDRKMAMCVVEKHRRASRPLDLFQTYLDDTVHQIDLLRFYCGDVEPIETIYTAEEKVLKSAVSLCKIPNAGLGVIQTSHQAGMWQERATLYGDDLTVEISAFRTIRVKHKDHEEIYGTERPGIWKPQLEERGFEGEVAHFFDCVNTRQRPMTDGHDSVKTQALLEALVEKSSAT